jgi:hypothetical protein
VHCLANEIDLVLPIWLAWTIGGAMLIATVTALIIAIRQSR